MTKPMTDALRIHIRIGFGDYEILQDRACEIALDYVRERDLGDSWRVFQTHEYRTHWVVILQRYG